MRGDIDARDRLIVALDVPTPDEARRLVEALGDAARFYKVGLELVLAGGLDLVRELRSAGHSVFLDMKLLDIGNTVSRSVAVAAKTGATFLTIHGVDRKTIAAAVDGRGETDLKVLGVTVLTSLDQDDLGEQHITTPVADLVAERARLIVRSGGDGIVASPQEASNLRAIVGDQALIITPGIRLAENESGDQTRIATPEFALKDGADYLVVGRPITQAHRPRDAALRFQDEIARTV
ncbi:MAG: orotidine-5'-phosphate decarboxylase [Pseudomonadota bacterium]